MKVFELTYIIFAIVILWVEKMIYKYFYKSEYEFVKKYSIKVLKNNLEVIQKDFEIVEENRNLRKENKKLKKELSKSKNRIAKVVKEE